MEPPHVFGNSAALGPAGVHAMTRVHDPYTKLLLDSVGIGPGSRCLDVGAGEGSIARWMADRAGPAGRVVATDADVTNLKPSAGVEVHRHDINEGMPAASTFDLIHVRSVLMRIPRRQQIFTTLLDALSPGGWIVIGELRSCPQEILSAPSAADAQLVVDITRTITDTVAEAAGVSWTWADEVEHHMAEHGLDEIFGVEYRPMLSNGNAVCDLHDSYVRQVEPLLYEYGYSPSQVERFYEVLHDPRFRARPFFHMVLTAGRKPESRAHGARAHGHGRRH